VDGFFLGGYSFYIRKCFLHEALVSSREFCYRFFTQHEPSSFPRGNSCSPPPRRTPAPRFHFFLQKVNEQDLFWHGCFFFLNRGVAQGPSVPDRTFSFSNPNQSRAFLLRCVVEESFFFFSATLPPLYVPFAHARFSASPTTPLTDNPMKPFSRFFLGWHPIFFLPWTFSFRLRNLPGVALFRRCCG